MRFWLDLTNHMEKEMASHSCVLAWRIPWTEESGRLQSMGGQRVRHDWSDLAGMHAEATWAGSQGFFTSYYWVSSSRKYKSILSLHQFGGGVPLFKVINYFNCGEIQIAWRRKWQPTPAFLPGKFHGQRSLGGYSPWGHKESQMI